MSDISELLIVGLPGTIVTNEIRDFVKAGVGGVILFSRNFDNPQRLRDFVDGLNDAAGKKLIIAVDQEGGRVMRFRDGFTPIPPMSHVGLVDGDGELSRQIGEVVARELSAVGVNLDFAPVLDVNTNPKNPVIGDRAFSSDAGTVARLGAAFIRGMEGLFVGACAKHFPGHGDTDLDSHEATPVVLHDRTRLDECELVPFRAAIAAGVSSVMTAHIINRNIDDRYPATVSAKTIRGMLRGDLGYGGLVVTDDLTMKGLSTLYEPHRSAIMAIEAGADIALVCSDDLRLHARVRDEMRRAADKGHLSSEIAGDAISRVKAFRNRFVDGPSHRPSLDILACETHRNILSAIA